MHIGKVRLTTIFNLLFEIGELEKLIEESLGQVVVSKFGDYLPGYRTKTSSPGMESISAAVRSTAGLRRSQDWMHALDSAVMASPI